jgi:dihydrofolate reductase
MIRFIAAIDSKQGLADEHGIPWQRKLPTDIAYFRAKTKGGIVLMGYRTYEEFDKPLPERRNLVASAKAESLRAGFERVHDASKFLKNTKEDVWVIGGAALFASTLDLADELYLTRVKGDFHCTKFFPPFEQDFRLESRSEPQTENGITFRFEVWRRKQ